MQSYWFSKQSKINIIYNISVITITITMSIILANFGKYAISDCPFIRNVFLFHQNLTHWGRVTHLCVSRITNIGSDNGLSPGRRQAIIWTNVGILLIQTLGTNFSEILREIHITWQLCCCGMCKICSNIINVIVKYAIESCRWKQDL